MNGQELLSRLCSALEHAGITYMLTGSLASSVHGVPRASNDFDIVIAPTVEQLRKLKMLLPESQYYFDLDEAVDTLRRKRQFNVIDLTSGWKVDFIIRKSRPFSLTEFARRLQIDFEGVKLYVATAEDVIIAKLEWAKIGGSQRQIEDVAGILKIRSNELDWDYIRRFVADLDIDDQWREALKTAGLQHRV
jgi:hypothetical protein